MIQGAVGMKWCRDMCQIKWSDRDDFFDELNPLIIFLMFEHPFRRILMEMQLLKMFTALTTKRRTTSNGGRGK